MEKRIITSENDTRKISEVLEQCEIDLHNFYTENFNGVTDDLIALIKSSLEIKKVIYLFEEQITIAKEKAQNRDSK